MPHLHLALFSKLWRVMFLGTWSEVSCTVCPHDQHRTSTWVTPDENKRCLGCSGIVVSLAISNCGCSGLSSV